MESSSSIKRQRVSRTAFITILVVVLVLLIAFVIALGVVTVSKINKNCDPGKVAAVELKRGMLDLYIPTKRVQDSLIPQGVTRSVISNKPIVDQLSNFVTDEEADYVVHVAKGRFKPSTTMSMNGSERNKDRTSESVFLNTTKDVNDAVLKRIRQRASVVSGVPESYFEPLQVVKYEHGQFYRQHFDYLDDRSQEVIKHGQRTLTILVYLNTLGPDEEGGGTKFHVLDYTVKPEKGSAVMWHNVSSNGSGDARTLHSGEPLTHPGSVKYAINIWARDRPQT